MKKMLYQQLTDYLVAKLPVGYRGKFYSEMSNGKIRNIGKDVTETGLQIAHIEYDAVLFFDELPFKKIDPLLLMAIIALWLNEIGLNEDIYPLIDFDDVDFDLSLIDDETADLNLTIHFIEPISAALSPQGELEINHRTYTLSNVELNIAEEIDIIPVINNE